MLVVSGYYKIPSKQPHTVYMGWIKTFFELIKVPVLFFTEQESLSELQAMAGPNVIFRICPFHQLDVFQEFPMQFWNDMKQIDPLSIQTAELGAIWASKKYFVKRAAEAYPDEEWFIWVDAGCIRNEDWREHCRNFTKRALPSIPGIYMQRFDPVPLEKEFFVHPDKHIAGGLILHHRDFIDRYIEDYNTELKQYSENKYCGIMDQYIMASMSKKVTYVTMIPVENPDLPVYDPWFYFLAYY
jgi:hypothetical protein